MIAIKEIQEVKSGVVTVKLPDDFTAKRVEIIILPIEENGEEGQARSLANLLLTGPTLNEEELAGFIKAREWMSQWDVKEF